MSLTLSQYVGAIDVTIGDLEKEFRLEDIVINGEPCITAPLLSTVSPHPNDTFMTDWDSVKHRAVTSRSLAA